MLSVLFTSKQLKVMVGGADMAGRDLNVGWEASKIDAQHPFEFVGNTKDYFGG